MVGDTGLEQPAQSPSNSGVAGKGGAKSGAVGSDSGPAAPAAAPVDLSPDVADLARRLAALPEAVRASLLVAVNAAKPQERKV